ncbi:MAG: hypothetical protein K6G01_11295 [Eubacterium sp.]|nr:hypothetical protein [Eubacterium sp.]
MKKNVLTRLFAFSLSFALVFGLAACGNSAQTTESANSTEASSDAGSTESSTQISTDDVTIAPADTEEEVVSDDPESTLTGSVSTQTKVNSALIGILSAINTQVQPETAGSSANAEACAQELMDWGSNTSSSNSVIKYTVKSFMSKLSSSEKKDFKKRLKLVDKKYKSMIKGSDKIAAVETVMKKAGVR